MQTISTTARREIAIAKSLKRMGSDGMSDAAIPERLDPDVKVVGHMPMDPAHVRCLKSVRLAEARAEKAEQERDAFKESSNKWFTLAMEAQKERDQLKASLALAQSSCEMATKLAEETAVQRDQMRDALDNLTAAGLWACFECLFPEFKHGEAMTNEDKIRLQAYENWEASGRPLFDAAITFANWIDAVSEIDDPQPVNPSHNQRIEITRFQAELATTKSALTLSQANCNDAINLGQEVMAERNFIKRAFSNLRNKQDTLIETLKQIQVICYEAEGCPLEIGDLCDKVLKLPMGENPDVQLRAAANSDG